MENEEEYFIINRMYAGAYINESKNIGHEIINLFADDTTKSPFS